MLLTVFNREQHRLLEKMKTAMMSEGSIRVQNTLAANIDYLVLFKTC